MLEHCSIAANNIDSSASAVQRTLDTLSSKTCMLIDLPQYRLAYSLGGQDGVIGPEDEPACLPPGMFYDCMPLFAAIVVEKRQKSTPLSVITGASV